MIAAGYYMPYGYDGSKLRSGGSRSISVVTR